MQRLRVYCYSTCCREGEIVDNVNHTFFSTKGATPSVDLAHWAKFPGTAAAFRQRTGGIATALLYHIQ